MQVESPAGGEERFFFFHYLTDVRRNAFPLPVPRKEGSIFLHSVELGAKKKTDYF